MQGILLQYDTAGSPLNDARRECDDILALSSHLPQGSIVPRLLAQLEARLGKVLERNLNCHRISLEARQKIDQHLCSQRVPRTGNLRPEVRDTCVHVLAEQRL